jgi:hypothetical protein
MATIKAQHSDHFPSDGADKHRETSKRRLFAMAVCQAENEGLPDTFAVRRTYTEEPEKRSKKAGNEYELIKITINAVFTS